MSRPLVADFVDAFFTRTLFQPDDTIATAILEAELSPDADIVINGNTLSVEAFTSLITTQFRGAFLATIVDITDLNIALSNNDGTTGVVGQYTKYETRSKKDGEVLKQSATTIVKVEERQGKRRVTAIWEAQTVDEA